MMMVTRIAFLILILVGFIGMSNRKKTDLGHDFKVIPITSKKPKPIEKTRHSYDSLFLPNLGDGFRDPLSGKVFTGKFIHKGVHKTIRIGKKISDSLFNEQWHTGFIGEKSLYPLMRGKVLEKYTREDSIYLRIEHVFLENGRPKNIIVHYGPFLSSPFNTNDTVHSECLGKIFNDPVFCIERQNALPVFIDRGLEKYLRENAVLTVPSTEKKLLVAVKKDYLLYYFENGQLLDSFDICLGQEPLGHKQQEGDNRTPEGEYRITEMEKGPFYGGTGPWLGDRWMHFSYPNRYDAYSGYQRGLLTKEQYQNIEKVDLQKGKTNSFTKLGGRVGLHGWNGSFMADGTQNLTWGCVCMQNPDIIALFEKVEMNTKLIILP
jgi:lipoprotein-anchoring transpeptidase ErfK/SrfK